jgi:hypothetical protein
MQIVPSFVRSKRMLSLSRHKTSNSASLKGGVNTRVLGSVSGAIRRSVLIALFYPSTPNVLHAWDYSCRPSGGEIRGPGFLLFRGRPGDGIPIHRRSCWGISILSPQLPETIEKVTGSQDDDFVGLSTKNIPGFRR